MTIRQTQCLLEYLGYEPGAIDGLAVDGVAWAEPEWEDERFEEM